MAISKETASLVTAFKDPLIKALGDIKNEVEYFLDNGVSEYVEVIRDKYLFTKTFLFRNDRVKFYETFFPVKLKYKNSIIDISDNPLSIFENKRCVAFIGSAGSGKSMLMKHIFLKTVENYTLIPLVIELRFLNDYKGSLTEYIYDKIFNNRLSPNNRILERILAEGNFLFLLDGYDELYSESKAKVTNEIDDFIDKYSKNHFLITSRPGANVESLPRFDSMSVQSLSREDISNFIKIQLQQTEYPGLSEKIIEAIGKNENKAYGHYLGNPLLLSMFILTFESHPVLPKSKNRFYWNVFDTLASRHDSVTKKGGYQHERKTNLQAEDLENILKWFSYHSLFEGVLSFDRQYLTTKLQLIKSKLDYKCDVDDLIDDLTVALAIIIIDGLEYKFPHRSMQEYFSALLIKDLPQEIKKKIYSEKVAKLYDIYNEVNNFWDLCLELDENDFMESCILHIISSFHNDLTKSGSDVEKIRTFCSLTGQSNRILIRNNLEVIEITDWQSANHFNVVMDFIHRSWVYNKFLPHDFLRKNIERYRDLKLLKSENVHPEIDRDYLQEDGENLSVLKLEYNQKTWDLQTKFIDLAIEFGYDNTVNEIINALFELMQDIQIKIEQSRGNTLSLLEEF